MLLSLLSVDTLLPIFLTILLSPPVQPSLLCRDRKKLLSRFPWFVLLETVKPIMSASLTLVVHSHHIFYILFIVFTTFYIVVHTWRFSCNQPYCGPLSERTLPHCTFYTSVSPNTAIPDSRLRSGPI